MLFSKVAFKVVSDVEKKPTNLNLQNFVRCGTKHFPINSYKMPDNNPYRLKACFKYFVESICECPMLSLIAILSNLISGMNYNERSIKVNLKI